MIYVTPFNQETKLCTGPSVDSGFTSLEQVEELMPEARRIHHRIVTVGETAYSDFVFCKEG